MEESLEARPDDEVWARHHSFVERKLRRNYAATLVHGVFGMTGFRLIYAPTIIPAYLYMLTGSAATVGVGMALLQLGGTLSPILSGARVESRSRILPYSIAVGSLMRLMVLALALTAWFLDGPPLLLATLAIFLFLGFFQGAQRVAFQMLMAKVIPIAQRGRLQGVRNLLGGGIAAVLAWAAGTYFIEEKWLGNGFATTFLFAFLLTSVGLFVLQFGIREPDAPRLRQPVPIRERWGQFGELLQHRGYRAFLFAHGFSSIARVGLPFWTLYVGEQLGLSGALIGSLSLAYLASETISNVAWGSLGDRVGFRLVYLGGLACSLAGMTLLVTVDGWWLHLAFVALGFGMSGWMMAAMTLVLEFGAHEDIPMRIALTTTVEGAVSSAGPVIAGLAIAALGFAPLIVASFVSLALALAVIVWRVAEPRHQPS
ncbi:MFS transporter [Parerythrobacter aestuarii]|uniref:MFS transporter n=1 Tax=Parerythrobacter aestuarii TaxID=3020909 RepID=UPI0024DEBEF5|nr:MFS transporter [Parerythrobacter aestuarii]